ncbi:MAG: haloacid dehalogenase [Caldilineaceae bacterium]
MTDSSHTPISLADIVELIRQDFITTSQLRDETLRLSRALVRSCANAIRAIHRHEWTEAETLLQEARADAAAMVTPLAEHPALYHAGYTQDALKELVEAHVVYAIVRDGPLPTPAALYVTGATYLRGLSEAGTEMRRFVLDLMRQGQVLEAEPYLAYMDEIYSLLMTIDFPDAITDGLRRQTDVLRNVLERTRGDLTLAIRQDQMRDVLRSFETRLGATLGLDLQLTDETPTLEAEDDHGI